MSRILRASGAIIMALAISGSARAERQDKQQTTQSDRPNTSKENKEQKKVKQGERAEKAENLPQLLMRPDDDPAALDLYHGQGGKASAPDSTGAYTFIAEDLSQTQPKIDVKDMADRRYRIKLGPEARPETAATRLIWAAGYFVDEDYYLDHLAVERLPALKRGQRYVHGNIVRGARLKFDPEQQKNLGNWEWEDNPFAGTRELNGLRVMMALLNNWDLVNRNNKIYSINGERRYVVGDLGATFGRSGNELTRKDGDLEAYAHSKFIEKVSTDTVDFVNHSRPLPVMALGLGRFKGMPHYYSDLVDGERVVKNIPRADARWIGQRLAQLSDGQIRDCFLAAGYSTEEAEGYLEVVRRRIADLNNL